MSHTRNGFSWGTAVLLVLAGLLVGAQPTTAAAQALNVTMMPLPEVAADGQPRGVNFVVTQANGMLANDATVTWSHVDKGTISGCQAAGAGILACLYTPPADGAAGQAVMMLDISAGGQTVSKHFTIPLTGAAAAAPAPAPVAPAPVAPAPVAPAPVAPAPVAPEPVAPAPAPVAPAPAPVAPAPAVTPPAPVAVPPPLPATSYLTVSAKPWATVYLDGVIVGNTPIKEAPIDPGQHTLVLRCGPCAEPQERRYSFNVTGGDTYTNVTTDFTSVPATAAAPPPATPAATPAVTPPATPATTPATAQTELNKFPYTGQPYRMGRVIVRYPVIGYRYSQATGVCQGDRPCPHFVDLDVSGPNGSGPVGTPAAIGVHGEFFPVEFIGVAASYETFRFTTDHAVVHEDGSEGTFGDAINRVSVGARVRLPLLNNRAQGPLDIIADIGYAGQDFLYFETTDVENAWTFSNLWANGVRFGFGARFQAVPGAEIHGSWHGTAVGSGLVSHEADFGVNIRVYKMIAVELDWLLVSRSVTVAKSYAQEETAAVSDFGTGLGIGVGAVF